MKFVDDFEVSVESKEFIAKRIVGLPLPMFLASNVTRILIERLKFYVKLATHKFIVSNNMVT